MFEALDRRDRIVLGCLAITGVIAAILVMAVDNVIVWVVVIAAVLTLTTWASQDVARRKRAGLSPAKEAPTLRRWIILIFIFADAIALALTAIFETPVGIRWALRGVLIALVVYVFVQRRKERESRAR